MARFGDALVEDDDLEYAAEHALAMALEPLDGRSPDLTAVFVCGREEQATERAMQRVAAVGSAGAVVGCTASGVIGDGRGLEGGSAVAVWCAVLPDVRLRSFALEVMPTDDGLAVIGMPEPAGDDVASVVLADPWSFPVDGFVASSNESHDGLPIVGGIAAGAQGRGSTRLLVNGNVVDRGAVGVTLSGAARAYPLVSQGCRPIGPAMTVTKADQNVILELAGMPAVPKLREVLSGLSPVEVALAASGLQVGLARDEYVEEHGQGDFLIRGIAGADADRDGLVVGDLVPVGSTVRFQVRDADAADSDLRAVLTDFRDNPLLPPAQGALLFSCNGRGAALFGSADHDPMLLRQGLTGSGVAGFFAAGEIGPVGGRNFVHGFTASMLAFTE
ncbi:MAG TPA: FIST N-terminal domain-containing protein [Mycobacteriales bacterium]|nr:FIST N-terminal domain-containing protein [Mycobacteriales bacterium]